VEVNLNVLSDQILAPGEYATFRFTPANAINNVQAMSIDNVAVMGAATATELRVLTYNIHGGEGPDGEGDPGSNLTAFRNTFMNNEDVLCLQEVNLGDCWTAVQTVFSDYPHRYQTINETTRGFGTKQTSIAVVSKYPFLSTQNQLIQTDPGGDEWERHAQHVTIQVGEQVVDIFNFHNTYNWFNDDYESEKEGLTKFRDNYVFPRLGISSVVEADRLIMLGDFNVLHANVTAILAPPDLKYNGLDHIASAPFFTIEGVYATAAADLSDHNAVWASLDIQAPSPDPTTWASVPQAAGSTSIRMMATSAADPSGVEYYFSNTNFPGGSHDSGWQSSPIYVDTGLTPATTYSYTVNARDRSANVNTSSTSAVLSVTTDPLAPLSSYTFRGATEAERLEDKSADADFVKAGATPDAVSLLGLGWANFRGHSSGPTAGYLNADVTDLGNGGTGKLVVDGAQFDLQYDDVDLSESFELEATYIWFGRAFNGATPAMFDMSGGTIRLSAANAFRSSVSYATIWFNLTGGPGSTTIIQEDNSNAGSTLTSRVNAGYFRIDGTRVFGTGEANAVNGHYLHIETSGNTQTLTIAGSGATLIIVR
jgi:endonuclease/exonuclease/phosphatase family metal-dependent hydrolase